MDARFLMLMTQEAALAALKKAGWWGSWILGSGSFGCSKQGCPRSHGQLVKHEHDVVQQGHVRFAFVLHQS